MALQVRRDAFPQQLARIQNNLAVTSNKIRGKKAENIERAIAYYTPYKIV